MNWLYGRLFAAGRPDAVAIETSARVWRYADLADESARMAAVLAGLGVAPGDRIAVQVEKSAVNLILWLAAVRAGAVYVPLNPAYTQAELGFFLTDAAPALIVCDPGRREEVAAIADGGAVETLDGAGQGSLTQRLAAGVAPSRAVARAAGDLAAICYTSGTTGRSKGAMLSHGALVANAETLKDIWRFTADDVLIHALPIYHVHGLFIATHVSLMAGATMILQPRFDPEAVLAALPTASAMMGVPTFYTRLLRHEGLTREAAGHMRLFVSGSAPLLAQTHEAWTARTGKAIVERYGMTETGMNTSNPYDGPRVPGAVGPPLPGVQLRIVDAAGATVAAGEAGQVQVRGPNVFSGYWRNPEKTAQAFTDDGWFSTGDVGSLDGAGYLRLVGRESDLIISGGLNIYPAEVEEAIDAIPGVIESAVIGLPHADLGEAPAAIVVRQGPASVSEEEVLAALEGRLARFKRPRAIVFAAELPRNAMGKVTKAALRAAHARLFDLGGAV